MTANPIDSKAHHTATDDVRLQSSPNLPRLRRATRQNLRQSLPKKGAAADLNAIAKIDTKLSPPATTNAEAFKHTPFENDPLYSSAIFEFEEAFDRFYTVLPFSIKVVDAGIYCRVLLDKDCCINEKFSFALSIMARSQFRAPTVASSYIDAFESFFLASCKTIPNILSLLDADNATVRQTVRSALINQNFDIQRRRVVGGGYDVMLRSQEELTRSDRSTVGGSATHASRDDAKLRRAYLALLTLSHCYDILILSGMRSGENPLRIDNAAAIAKLASSAPVSPWANPYSSIPTSTFSFKGIRQPYSNLDERYYAQDILSVAENFPIGLQLATRIMVETGARVSEPLSLNITDWAAKGLRTEILCPNKGSRGSRTKVLTISEDLALAIEQYVANERARITGLSLAEIKAIAQLNLKRAEWRALSVPLLLSPRGRRIGLSNFRDYYWRPRMRDAGLEGITPHVLRHEHARRALFTIYTHPDTAEHPEHWIEQYAEAQGWASGIGMVEYYAGPIGDIDRQKVIAVINSGPTSDAAEAVHAQQFADSRAEVASQRHRLDALRRTVL